jgi:N,N'-diacetyllegionaminate synthase
MNKKPLLIIAEIAQAHDGSLGILHSYIDALVEAGVDVVKFQTHIAEAESSSYEPFRVNFSYEDATRYDYWERMGFSEKQWVEIKAHCDEVGIEFMSSCFSQAAVDMMERIGMARYKIGSGEVTNFLILEKIARTGKPIILSSGMSNLKELDEAVEFISTFGNDLTVLQCTTAYPTPPDRVGLNVMNVLRERYPDVKVGLSEHTAMVATGIAAAALGAEVLEFHAVFDRRMFGPDAKSSLTIDEVKTMVDGVRQVETMLANPIDKADNSKYTTLKSIFEKSLAVSRDLPAGHLLTFADLEAKKPAGHGIAASKFNEVVGRKLARTLTKYDFITDEHLA